MLAQPEKCEESRGDKFGADVRFLSLGSFIGLGPTSDGSSFRERAPIHFS